MKTFQRHVSFSPVDSASASAPWAPTGAIGNGRFSLSEVMRKSVYPAPNQATLVAMYLKAMRATAGIQALWNRVRCTRAGESAGGDTHSGICPEMPNPSAAVDWTRY